MPAWWGRYAPHSGSTENWPRDDRGELVPPAFLEHISGDEISAQMERTLLESYGIPTVYEYPGDGRLGKVVLGNCAEGIDVYVPETLLTDARNILSADIDEGELNGE